MTFTPPSNESSLLNQLSPNEQAHYRTMRLKAVAAAEENPHLNTDIYTQYFGGYLHAAVQHRNEMAGMRQRAVANNFVIGPMGLTPHSNILKEQFQQDFNNNVVRNASKQDQQAWATFSEKVNGPDFFVGTIRNVFDSRKGGFQLGGIVGAAVGAFMGWKVVGEGVSNMDGFSIMGLGVAVAMGTWAGNTAMNALNNTLGRSSPTFPVVSTPGKGRALVTTVGTEPSMDKPSFARLARPENLLASADAGVNPLDTGGFKPPAPVTATAPTTKTTSAGFGGMS